MMYQIIRCPTCNRLHDSRIYREKTASPLAFCLPCLSTFVDTSVNEWELRSVFGKIFYVLFALADVAISGVLIGMLVLFVIILPDVIFKTEWSKFIIDSGAGFIALLVICVIINLIRVISRESKYLKASKVRMADPAYRQRLESAGLLK